MKEKFYTADDWMNGIIHDDLKKRELPVEVLNGLKNVGFLSEILFRKNYLSKKDYNIIEGIMKDTFFRVLEHNIEQRLDFFRSKLESAYRPELLLDERINELQRKLDKADNYTREQAFRGEWSKFGIDFETYRKINDEKYKRNSFSLIVFTPSHRFRDRLGGFHMLFTDKYYLWQNLVFDVSEILRLREKLVELRDNKKSFEENFDKRREGTHKENKSWVQNKFHKIRSETSSDNEAVEKVMKAYGVKFNKRIGKSTVQRFVGIV